MRDQKRKRRWRWIFRSFFFLLLILLLIKIGLLDIDKKSISQYKPHVGLIDVKGTIFDGQAAGAENFAKSLMILIT